MGSVADAVVSQRLKTILRQSSSYSYGSVSLPKAVTGTWPRQRGVRAATVERVMILRDRFNEDVMSAYNSIESGQVKLLCAGTGVGKTTEMPHMISKTIRGNGLVLMPDNLLVMRTQPYVQQMITERWHSEVNTAVLRSTHLELPLSGVVIYYSSAADFLAKFSGAPNILDVLGVRYVYLDEAHENRPDYYFMRILVTMNVFSSVKMFYGSATATRDFNLEGGGMGRSVNTITERDIPLGDPFSTPATSPAHYSKIESRVLVFLPDDAEIELWRDYYDTHDLIVFSYGHSSSSRDLASATAQLAKNRVCVFLTTAILSTGHTFDIDKVIICGKREVLKYDLKTPSVKLVRRNLTLSERIQQTGRVGRHKKGFAFYVDNKCEPEPPELVTETAIYVYLWSVLFNIEIKNPYIADFADAFGDMTADVAAVYLNSRLPPMLLIPYLGEKGFYIGWANVMRSALYSGLLKEDDQCNTTVIQSWPVKHLTPNNCDVSGEYKCKVAFPDEWDLLPYHAWLVFNGGIRNVGTFDDSRSVISGISDQKPILGKKERTSVTELQVRPKAVSRRVSESSNDSVDRAYVPPKYDDVEETMSRRSTVQWHTTPTVKFKQPSMSPVVEDHSFDNSKRESLQQWVGNVDVETKKERRSSSSHSSETLSLICKDPVKYKYYKLYPMDDKILAMYMSSERLRSQDIKRFSKLMDGTRKFYSLHSNDQVRRSYQIDYFLSVIRVHNSAVVERLQIAANSTSPTGVQKFFGSSLSGRTERNGNDILATSRLLLACQVENFFVGVDKRTLHVGDGTYVSDSTLDLDETRAYYSLAYGSNHVANIIIPKIVFAAKPFYLNGILLTNAFLFNQYLITTAHAYTDNESIRTKFGQYSLSHIDEADDFVVVSTNVSSNHTYTFKEPTHGMNVYVIAANYSKRVAIYGVFTVVGSGAAWLLSKAFMPGYSGAFLVDVNDGCVVGMYLGKADNFGQGDYGRVLSSSSFASFLL